MGKNKRTSKRKKYNYKIIHPGYLWSNDVDLFSNFPKSGMDDKKYDVIDDKKYDIIKTMLQENLNHARHVENERITYHGFYAALTAGCLAFIATVLGSSNIPSILIYIFMCIILILLGLLTLRLCERWTNAFERHLEYAKGCYYMLHRDILGIEDKSIIKDPGSKEKFELERDPIGTLCKEPLGLDTLPLYCFRIKNPKDLFITKSNNSRTKSLFRAFDMAVITVLQFRAYP